MRQSRTAILRPPAILVLSLVATACGQDGPTAPPVPATLSSSGGTNQTGIVGKSLGDDLSITVLDDSGRPVHGVAVAWSTDDGGSLTATSSATDTDGVARATWTLGPAAGTQTAEARVSGVAPASFTATAEPDAPAVITVSPDTLLFSDLEVAEELSISVQDRFENPISDVDVEWTTSDAEILEFRNNGEVVSLASGISTYTARVGGAAEVEATLFAAVDNIGPGVTISDPTTTGFFSTTEDAVSILGQASDNLQVVSLDWSLNGEEQGSPDGLLEWAIPEVGLTSGENTVTVIGTDLIGRADTASITIIRNTGVSFLAPPSLTPATVAEGSTTSVAATVPITPVDGAEVISASLVLLGAGGAVEATVATLADDGNLSNGDEILSDGIYSGIGNLTVDAAGPRYVRVDVVVRTMGEEFTARSEPAEIWAVSDVTQEQVDQVVAVQRSAVEEFRSKVGTGFDQAVSQVKGFLDEQEGVASVSQRSQFELEVEYESGLSGGIVFSVQDAQGGHVHAIGVPNRFSTGHVPPAAPTLRTPHSTRDVWSPLDPGALGQQVSRTPSTRAMASNWFGLDTIRSAKRTIPLHKQTRGIRVDAPHAAAGVPLATDNDPDHTIRSKDVLIYDPSATEFFPYNKGDDAREILKDSRYGLEITHVENSAATVDVLLDAANYGLVIIDTHGAGGWLFLTGEIVAPEDDSYDALIESKQLRIVRHVVVETALDWLGSIVGVTGEQDVYAATDRLIRNLPGRFPNSVILASYCEGLTSTSLASAFTGKGAQTYLGWDDSFYSSTGKDALLDVLEKFVGDAANIGEAHTEHVDPKSGARFRLFGEPEAHYTTGLLNGGFEAGDLSGWEKSGDGRVISQLGGLQPTAGSYMGIISTGLGFTTTSGAIRQELVIGADDTTLRVHWNFISEEFLEYIGSEFQDFFRITIRRIGSGQPTVLYSRAIDEIAAEFQLTRVSPEVVFDIGDVYMTGWLSTDLEISSFAGERVILEFSAGDVGDSLFDTAVLLDELEVTGN